MEKEMNMRQEKQLITIRIKQKLLQTLRNRLYLQGLANTIEYDSVISKLNRLSETKKTIRVLIKTLNKL